MLLTLNKINHAGEVITTKRFSFSIHRLISASTKWVTWSPRHYLQNSFWPAWTFIADIACHFNPIGVERIHPFKTLLHMIYNIARTHTHAETRCIISAWEAWSCRPSAIQVLMMHQVGKSVSSAQAWVLAFIPCPVRNNKAAMRNLSISTKPMELCLGHGIMCVYILKEHL